MSTNHVQTTRCYVFNVVYFVEITYYLVTFYDLMYV